MPKILLQNAIKYNTILRNMSTRILKPPNSSKISKRMSKGMHKNILGKLLQENEKSYKFIQHNNYSTAFDTRNNKLNLKHTVAKTNFSTTAYEEDENDDNASRRSEKIEDRYEEVRPEDEEILHYERAKDPYQDSEEFYYVSPKYTDEIEDERAYASDVDEETPRFYEIRDKVYKVPSEAEISNELQEYDSEQETPNRPNYTYKISKLIHEKDSH